jgi:transposase
MMIGCAVSTGLPGCDERVRVTAAASGERPGQGCGDLGAAPPDHGARTAAGHDPAAVLSRDRAFLAALLHRLPRDVLGRFRLLVRPETVLRWHRDLLARSHAARSHPRRLGRPRTVHSIRQLVVRLAAENPCWGYRRIHGELLVLGIKVAASTVWEILQQAGIDPAPERTTATWASFLFPPLSGRGPACLRLLRDRHLNRHPPARAGGHRARHPADPDPRCDPSSHCVLGCPGREESRHGP